MVKDAINFSNCKHASLKNWIFSRNHEKSKHLSELLIFLQHFRINQHIAYEQTQILIDLAPLCLLHTRARKRKSERELLATLHEATRRD